MKRKNVATELAAAMREAAAIAKGQAKPGAVHQIPLPLGVNVRAVRAARAYLTVIARRPKAAVEALEG
jgi:hypothetical protein